MIWNYVSCLTRALGEDIKCKQKWFKSHLKGLLKREDRPDFQIQFKMATK